MIRKTRKWPKAILVALCSFIFTSYLFSSNWDAEIVVPSGPNPTIGKYKKVELGVDLPGNVDCAIKEYLASESSKCWDQDMITYTTCFFTPPPLNPYAPEEIKLYARFVAPNGTVTTRPGFFYRDFERYNSIPQVPIGSKYQEGEDTWREIPTAYDWRVRFAPDQIGTWTVTLHLEVPEMSINQQLPYSLTFNCIASGKKGYVTSGSSVPAFAKQHLYYEETGETFFAVGENLVLGEFSGLFKNPNDQFGMWCNANDVLKRYNEEMNRFIDELDASGGNFARVTMSARGYSPEWQQLGCYDCHQGASWEFDKIVEKAEDLDLYFMLFLQWHNEFKNKLNYCGLSLYNWDNNLYKGITGSDPAAFFTNPTAKQFFKRRLRYIDARWGYSPQILSYELISEADRVLDNEEDYYDDTEPFQTDLRNWMSEMTDYIRNDLKDGRKRQLLTASFTQAYDYNKVTNPIWSLPNVDLICFHYYHPHEATNYRTRFTLQDYHWNAFYKPVMFNELGTSHSHLFESISDMNLHNNIWATSMMGGFGGGLNWHANAIHELNNQFQENFAALAAFMEGEDLASKQWHARKDRSWGPQVALDWIETFYMADESLNAKKVIGWAHNRSFYGQNLHLHPGNFVLLGGNIPMEVDLGDRLFMAITETYNGNPRFTQEERCSFLFDPLSLSNDYPHTNYPSTGSPNLVQCTVGSPPNSYSKDVPPFDYAFYDPMRAMPSCTLRLYGLEPNQWYETEWYNTRIAGGAVTSSTDKSDLYGQLDIIVPATDFDNRDWAYKVNQTTWSKKTELNSMDNLPIFEMSPNPSQGLVTLSILDKESQGGSLKILNQLGQVVWDKQLRNSNNCEVDLSDQPKGVYFVRFQNATTTQTKKLVLQ